MVARIPAIPRTSRAVDFGWKQSRDRREIAVCRAPRIGVAFIGVSAGRLDRTGRHVAATNTDAATDGLQQIVEVKCQRAMRFISIPKSACMAQRRVTKSRHTWRTAGSSNSQTASASDSRTCRTSPRPSRNHAYGPRGSPRAMPPFRESWQPSP